MENVLSRYALPYDPRRLVVCMDEKPLHQLLSHKRKNILREKGKPLRKDSEYICTCSFFMFNEPLGKYRYVDAKDHRTKIDWAHQGKRRVDEDYPDAEVVLRVLDNLNTHKIGLKELLLRDFTGLEPVPKNAILMIDDPETIQGKLDCNLHRGGDLAIIYIPSAAMDVIRVLR